MSRKKGPACSKCGGPTYISTWGDAPVTSITYCEGCNKMPHECPCKKTENQKDR